MNMNVLRSDLQDSLLHLGEKMRRSPIPREVVEAAVKANPWFTPYYLEESVRGIATWLEEDPLKLFLKKYPEPSHPLRRVGIIAAGNIPLVGWHDLMITILSGHHAVIRTSRQDRVMMEWLMQQWMEIFPNLQNLLHAVRELPAQSLDYLLATGSNNSARYFKQNYASVPGIIRHHRYSVAILSKNITDCEMHRLCKDLLLYNTLGCRNVCNIIASPEVDLRRLVDSLHHYSTSKLNPMYLERVLYVNHLKGVLGESIVQAPNLIIEQADQPGSTEMGVVKWIELKDSGKLDTWLRLYEKDWQCVVGSEVKYGQAQYPELEDYADGVNTMDLLCKL